MQCIYTLFSRFKQIQTAEKKTQHNYLSPSPPPPRTTRVYPVRKGEGLADIIGKRSITREEIKALNPGVNVDRLKGAVLAPAIPAHMLLICLSAAAPCCCLPVCVSVCPSARPSESQQHSTA